MKGNFKAGCGIAWKRQVAYFSGGTREFFIISGGKRD